MTNCCIEPAMTIGQMVTAIPVDELKTWPDQSRNAALESLAKYGLPDVVGSEVLIWKNGSNPIVVEKNNGFMGRMVE